MNNLTYKKKESTYFTVARAGFLVFINFCLALVLTGKCSTHLRMGWDEKRANKRTSLVAALIFG